MRTYNDNQIAYIWLNSIPDFTIDKKRDVLSVVDQPSDLLRPERCQTKIVGLLGESVYAKLSNFYAPYVRERIQNELKANNAVAIVETDIEFPDKLRNIPSAPICLIAKGNLGLLNKRSVAVLGTRNPSKYGVDIAKRFSAQLSESGLVIVSGMARGIDSIAHKSTLEHDGNTIAVVGSGLDIVYPVENKALFDEICEKGLVVTEYWFGIKPLRYHFPQRNRIISGLSEGVLVPEAGESSGSLITVDLAIEQGKEVFLVPGNIFSKTSRGCNLKLKNYQTTITIDVSDVLNTLGIDYKSAEEKVMQMDIFEEIVYTALELDQMHFDELVTVTKLSPKELTTLLTRMELRGIISKLPGNYYCIDRG